MRARLCALVVLVAGCRQIFGLHDLDDTDAGSAIAIVEGGGSGFAGTIADGTTTRGELAPDVYVAGGFHATGFDSRGVTSNTELDDPGLGPPTGETYGVAPGTYPIGIGGLFLASTTDFSATLDGEIFLEAGTNALDFIVTGQLVAEVKIGDTTTRFEAATSDDALAHLDVPASDWYPIRAAYSTDGSSTPTLIMTLQPPGQAGPNQLTPTRLRARTSDLAGTHGIVASGEVLQDLIGTARYAGALDPSLKVFADYSVMGAMSVRFEGQVYADADGTHAVDVTLGSVGDSARVFIDGALVANYWTSGSHGAVQSTLVHGWNPLVVDFAHSGSAKLGAITLTIDGVPVAADHLRPMTPITTSNSVPTTCDYNSSVHCSLGFDQPQSGVLDDVELAGVFLGQLPDNLVLANGSIEDDILFSSISAANSLYAGPDGAFHDAPAPDVWDLSVAGPAGGQLKATVLTRSRGGFGEPIARAAVYTSPEFDVEPGKTLVSRQVDVVPETAAQRVSLTLRTADTKEALEQQPFAVPDHDLVLGAVVQYQVAIDSSGWDFATVTRVELDLK